MCLVCDHIYSVSQSDISVRHRGANCQTFILIYSNFESDSHVILESVFPVISIFSWKTLAVDKLPILSKTNFYVSSSGHNDQRKLIECSTEKTI